MTKILLVEDSDLIRERMLSLLRGIEGLSQVDAACNLTDAEQRIACLKPDLLILDLSLPDGNAIHWVHRLITLAPAMDIAIYTNDATEFSRRKCFAAGAKWFFDKSAEAAGLLDVVRQRVNLTHKTIHTPRSQPQ